MPDAIFEKPRLAEIYDEVDGDRSDLALYIELVEGLGARTVLDVGCGTGTFACLLAERGTRVIGVDPAAASLTVARGKPHGDHVRWVETEADNLPDWDVDLVTMTGNVAQVFLTDDGWASVLTSALAVLADGGHLVFEVRRPDRRAWEGWTKTHTMRRIRVGGGAVTTWIELTDVELPLVSLRHTFQFEEDGTILTSDSTLRFRSEAEIRADLTVAGFQCADMREAPDRPGLEHVFVAELD